MSGLSHRAEVDFLEACSPALVHRNADEFSRLRDLLTEAEVPARRAQMRTGWTSDGSAHYEARVKEARALVVHLADGYDTASRALRRYGDALETAKRYYAHGKTAEKALADLIATKGTAVTGRAQEAEPMRQWEDMRGTTGVLDWFAEIGMDIDDIREEANRLHDDAGREFRRARDAEEEARETCVASLKRAYDLLPEYRLGLTEPVDYVKAVADLRREAAEAATHPLVRLPGSGP
jgi:uncharacterized protein YukE